MIRFLRWLLGLAEPVAWPSESVRTVPPLTAPTGRTRRSSQRVSSTRLTDLPIGDERHVDLGSGRGYSTGITGESRRQAVLRRLSAGRRERGDDVSFIAVLIPEPENPYDPNAVRVDIQGGDQIGYLAREDAMDYRTVFKALAETQKVGVCRAKLIGGTSDKPSFGVMVDLKAPDALLAAVAPGGQPF